MEQSTTIKYLLVNKKIEVPKYQRAYSWEESNIKQFISDIKYYLNSSSKYYMGHFLFEKDKKNESKYFIIDGQQRLTTILIFLSALSKHLDDIDMAKFNFNTVEYDNGFFMDNILSKCENKPIVETASQRRILEALKYFIEEIKKESKDKLSKMKDIIYDAKCSIYEVQNQSEAVQMFIYQNNRGKQPTNLEIIKAMFMYNIDIFCDDEEKTLDYVNKKFESIYLNLHSVEDNIDENNVLTTTLKTYYKNLHENNSIEKIEKELTTDETTSESKIEFIKNFSNELDNNFKYLKVFFDESKKEKTDFLTYSLIVLGVNSIIYPFISFAYKYDIPTKDKKILFHSLENILLRHRLIGTRAYLPGRLNDVYEEFIESKKIDTIIERIDYMKTSYDWFGNWNDDKLKESFNNISMYNAKFILWKYENNLSNKGYALRYDSIEEPNTEHIAPQKEPDEKPHGYDKYTDKFKNTCIHNIGNYLLLCGKHNKSVGNKPFSDKIETYTYFEQQKEIKTFIPENGIWGKDAIEKRKEKIVNFLIDYYCTK